MSGVIAPGATRAGISTRTSLWEMPAKVMGESSANPEAIHMSEESAMLPCAAPARARRGQAGNACFPCQVRTESVSCPS